MKPDIMDTKPKKVVATTMYEINDSGRNGEFTAGFDYYSSFVSFIESLGFEIDYKYKDHPSLGVVINGVQFAINTGNCSYMSKNGWTRDKFVRKPVNRFITLAWNSHDSNYVLKVFINKEMETEKLKSKINKAIEWNNNREQEIADRELNDKKNTETIGLHYLGNNTVKEALRNVLIEKGQIRFNFKDRFGLIINADSTFVSATFHPAEMKSFEDIDEFANSILTRTESFESVVKIILATEKISEELIGWSEGQYHKYFYTETMSTEDKY